MPHTITLSNIAWSTPDGHQLFSDINLSFRPERTGLIGRNGTGKSTLLAIIAGEIAPSTGTVSRPDRIGLLRQNIAFSADDTVADMFAARRGLQIIGKAEQGIATAEELAEADWTLESRLADALSRLGLTMPADTLLATLSGGERTRAALAALVFTEPDFLILDEPTNNLDAGGRQAVAGLLSQWRGGAVIVSHDRELLETMDAIIELTTLCASRYGGGYSQYKERKALELAAAEHDLADAEKRLTEIDSSSQAVAERKSRKDGAGKRKARRGDAPKILLGGMKERSENTGGSNVRLADRQRREANEEANAARERIEILQQLSIRLASTGLAAGKAVLRFDGVTAGHEPERPLIRNLDWTITGPERVAITGSNGTGKTTLLKLIAGTLQPWSGTVSITVPFAMLDQRVDILDPAGTIRDNFRRLNPETDENACRTALARFMFRADAALRLVSSLSGGETLRAGLACVLGGAKPPSLLLLDEPTNHLDLDSITAIEAGLNAYDGALVVVSHDPVFLANIGITGRLELGGRA